MTKFAIKFIFIFFALSLFGKVDSENSKFNFAVVGMDHGHIYGQTAGLERAGAFCKYAYDKDPKKLKAFLKKFPNAKAARSLDEILADNSVKLVASAIVPVQRIDIAKRVMESGRDFFADKPAVVSLEQLDLAKALVNKTGKKYIPYFGERFENASCTVAENLVKSGAIGKVVCINILAPHNLNIKSRPEWFFEKEKFGGIITDIGAHQFDIFLTYSGATSGTVKYARVENFSHKEYPQFEDFGEAVLVMDNLVSCSLRVDWFSPDKLGSWGDSRIFIVGDKGYIELRNNIDLCKPLAKQSLYLCVSGKAPELIDCSKQKNPFFDNLVGDILNRTENAITQKAAFMAMELALKTQQLADQTRQK